MVRSQITEKVREAYEAKFVFLTVQFCGAALFYCLVSPSVAGIQNLEVWGFGIDTKRLTCCFVEPRYVICVQRTEQFGDGLVTAFVAYTIRQNVISPGKRLFTNIPYHLSGINRGNWAVRQVTVTQ